MERKILMMNPGNSAVARGCALLLTSLLICSTGCDSTIATSKEFVHEAVCGRCGAPSQFDWGCPVQIMEYYPHTGYNALKKKLYDDAERFEREGESFDAIAATWGPPFEAVTIANARDAEQYGRMLTADQKSRFRIQVEYIIHRDLYFFLLDDRKRVLHFTSSECIGEYECSRCGGNFVRRPAR